MLLASMPAAICRAVSPTSSMNDRLDAAAFRAGQMRTFSCFTACLK